MCTMPSTPNRNAAQPIACRPAGPLCWGSRRLRQATKTSRRGTNHATRPTDPATTPRTASKNPPGSCHQTAAATTTASPTRNRPAPSRRCSGSSSPAELPTRRTPPPTTCAAPSQTLATAPPRAANSRKTGDGPLRTARGAGRLLRRRLAPAGGLLARRTGSRGRAPLRRGALAARRRRGRRTGRHGGECTGKPHMPHASHAGGVVGRGGRWCESAPGRCVRWLRRRASADVETPPQPGGRAASDGESGADLALAAGGRRVVGKSAATGRGTARGRRSASRVARPAVVEEGAPASGRRDHHIEGSRNFRNTSPQLPGNARIPGPGLSVLDARIPCMTTAFDDTGAAPGHVRDRRRLHTSCDERRRPRLWTLPAGRDRRQPDRPGRAAAPDHRARAPATPSTPTASTSAPKPAPPTPPPGGPTPPGRPNATPSAAWTSRTPWTATTNRSGTRWPPARSPRSRRW